MVMVTEQREASHSEHSRAGRAAADADRAQPVERVHLLVGRRIRAARLEQGMSLAQLGGDELSRSFISAVERGRARISLRALAIIAGRLKRPISYFVDDAPAIGEEREVTLDHAEAALAYSRLLQKRGETERALDYALWAAQVRLTHN